MKGEMRLYTSPTMEAKLKDRSPSAEGIGLRNGRGHADHQGDDD